MTAAPEEFAAALATAVDHLRRAEPVLAAVIERQGPCALAPDWQQPPFEALVRSIAYQQLHGTAAKAILDRLKARAAPRPFPSPHDILALEEAELRGIGFSRAKIAALRDVSEKALSGVVPSRDETRQLDDAALISRLTAIRGIGRWTVEMMLIFSLGRLDVLPLDDYGVRNGARAAFGLDDLPGRKALAALGEPWRPYRSVASWYLWRAAEAAKLKPRPRAQPAK
jgi:DNA-3-methyladenine glycosylase II